MTRRLMLFVPERYAPYFDVVHEHRLTAPVNPVWQCRRCQKRITPNVLAAQSHVAMHVRQADRAKGAK